MKKLQSLENFKNLGLSFHSMSKLTGGTSTPTEAGYLTVNTEISSTGCVSYTSDTTTNGNTVYHNYKDCKTANCN